LVQVDSKGQRMESRRDIESDGFFGFYGSAVEPGVNARGRVQRELNLAAGRDIELEAGEAQRRPIVPDFVPRHTVERQEARYLAIRGTPEQSRVVAGDCGEASGPQQLSRLGGRFQHLPAADYTRLTDGVRSNLSQLGQEAGQIN